MGAALLTLLREGLEASLIVGIVLAYLDQTGNRDRFRVVWAGTAAAVAASVATGAGLFFTVGDLEGRAERIFEGFAMLSAAVVLAWMIFWMRRQAAGIRRSLETKLETALAAGSAAGLAAVVFVAVLREGGETALFVFAISESSTPAATAAGALAGLALAIVLGAGVYSGSRRLDLRRFFTVSGVLLIVLAAGLAAHGTHELQEAALFPVTVEHVWNTNGTLDEGSTAGALLQALAGYDGDPSLLELGVWLAFLLGVLALFLRPLRIRSPAPA